MRLTRLLTLRSLRSRSLRFFLSAFGIVLGVAGMLSIRATNQTALQSIVKLFESTSGRAKLTIMSANLEEGGFNERILRKLDAFPGLQVATPIVRLQTDLTTNEPAGGLEISFFGVNSGGLTLYGIIPSREQVTRSYVITQGRFLTDDNSRKWEVVLVETYAVEEEIRVGDKIEILTPNGTALLNVVGLMAREGPGQNNNGAFGVVPLETAQNLFERGGDIDQIDLVPMQPNPSTAELAALRQSLQDFVGEDYSVTYPSGQGERMTQMLQNYQIGLNFMSGIALFVGAFLIYNAFAMTVIERTREFGMLRTIGMTRGQVMNQVLLEASLLGLLGSGLGVGMGILLARGLTRFMEVILGQPLGQVQVMPQDMLSSAALGLGVTFIAAALPAWQAGRISPIETLRVRAQTGEGWFVRYGWTLGALLLAASVALLILNPFPFDVQFRLGSMTVFGLFTGAALLIPVTVGFWEGISRPLLKLVYGPSGRLGSRNIHRSRTRTTLTVSALMVGVAMVIMVRGMTESFATDLRTWMQAYLGGDIYITSSVRLSDDVARRIRSVDGVRAVAPIRYFNVKWRDPSQQVQNINFMAVDVPEYTRVTNFVFSGQHMDTEQALEQLETGQAVFISSVLAEKYGLVIGDVVSLRTTRGFKDFQVAGIVVDFYNQGLVVQGSWDTMRRHFHINDASTFLVKAEDAAAVASLQARIDDLYGRRYHLTIESNESVRARALSLMDQAFRMFDVLTLISIVVGSLGVVNTLTMSVIERTREIGMLRAIGTTRGQIVRMVLAEAGLMGVIGGIVGLILGIVLARVLFIGMTTMSGYQLTFVLPPEAIYISMIAALIVSQLAAIPPSVRAARVHILEAIHFE
jgi:putative ABC transport system permease protein